MNVGELQDHRSSGFISPQENAIRKIDYVFAALLWL